MTVPGGAANFPLVRSANIQINQDAQIMFLLGLAIILMIFWRVK